MRRREFQSISRAGNLLGLEGNSHGSGPDRAGVGDSQGTWRRKRRRRCVAGEVHVLVAVTLQDLTFTGFLTRLSKSRLRLSLRKSFCAGFKSRKCNPNPHITQPAWIETHLRHVVARGNACDPAATMQPASFLHLCPRGTTLPNPGCGEGDTQTFVDSHGLRNISNRLQPSKTSTQGLGIGFDHPQQQKRR